MKATEIPLVLASASPRRRELLAQLGLPFEVVPPEVDESVRAGEDPRAYVVRLAREKVDRVASRRRDALVLAADTAVVLGTEILGKPRDAPEAESMLWRLSGRDHLVLTGVAIGRSPKPVSAIAVETRVWFRSLRPEEIRWYVRSGEPLDKAGAYGIQGLGGALVRRIEGSASNVVGLPVAETLDLLAACGGPLPWVSP